MTRGLSKARLERMHDVMAGYVERGEVPGLVTLVSRRGEVHVDAIGTTAVDGATPMARDTIFRISSMTKPVTAVATMILVEECKLRLDEPVGPAAARARRPAGRAADRRAARRHRARAPADHGARPADVPHGLRRAHGRSPDTPPIVAATGELGLSVGPPQPALPPAPDEWMRRLGTLPLMYQPGERWMYNTGSDVLGVLIARASGSRSRRSCASASSSRSA